MEQHRLTYLLEQYMADSATAGEREELSDILKADTHRELFNSVLAGMMQKETPANPANPELWQKMVTDIISIDKPLARPVKKTRARVIRWYKWTAAAAVLVIAMGIYFLDQSPISKTTHTKPPLSITPVVKNVLVLADGSQVLLDEAKNGPIGKQKNAIITKQDKQIVYTSTNRNAADDYNVISTANGGQYEVVLPDGSHVWLNAASSIRFPSYFSGQERSVELSGEAWFDVQHADQIPFLIHSGNITTTVLGTAFDIKAYPGQKAMIVAVQRGKVKVQAGNTILATLEKGRQIKVANDTTFYQSDIDPNSIAAWKQGNLLYKDEVLKDIIADLQRVFNQPIAIKKASLKEEMITVSFNKDIGLAKALEIICRITDSRLSNKRGIYMIE